MQTVYRHVSAKHLICHHNKTRRSVRSRLHENCKRTHANFEVLVHFIHMYALLLLYAVQRASSFGQTRSDRRNTFQLNFLCITRCIYIYLVPYIKPCKIRKFVFIMHNSTFTGINLYIYRTAIQLPRNPCLYLCLYFIYFFHFRPFDTALLRPKEYKNTE